MAVQVESRNPYLDESLFSSILCASIPALKMAAKFSIRKAIKEDAEEVFEMMSGLPMKTQEGVNFVIEHQESISLVAEKDDQIVGKYSNLN